MFRFRYILILTLLTMFAFCNNSKHNVYTFPSKSLGWYAIVVPKDSTKRGKVVANDMYDFRQNRILFANEYVNHAEDSFFLDSIQFLPNDTHQSAIKLCYFMGALNSGFSRHDRAREINSTQSGLSGFCTFDVYYFYVDSICEHKEITLEKFRDSVYNFILLSGY
jgi:hypothetical protein